LIQKNTRDHCKDMKIAIENTFQNEDQITIVTGDWKYVPFKKSLLILFSKTMRSCLASLSCCSEATIFLPDCSTDTVSKVQDLLEKQYTETVGKSFKVIQSVVEAANALGLDIDNLDYVAPLNPSIKARNEVNLSDEGPDSLNQKIDSKGETTKYDDEVTRKVRLRGSNSNSSTPKLLRSFGLKKKRDCTVAENKELQEQKLLQSDAIDVLNRHSYDDGLNEEEDDKEYEDESSSDGDINDWCLAGLDIQNIIKNKVKTASESVSAGKNLIIDETMAGETISEDEEPSDEEEEKTENNLSREGLKVILPFNKSTSMNIGVESENIHHGLREGFLTENMHKVYQSESSLEEASENIAKVSSEGHEKNISVENEEKKELPLHEVNVNENRFRCTLCKNIMRKQAVCTFKEHYSTAHFHKEIFEMYIRNPAETVCRVDGCGKEFEVKNKGNLVRHIGSTHNKVVEILQLKGLEVPVVLTENNANNKRKRSEIQSERSNKLKSEVGNNTFECPMCGSFYSSKSNLERHMVKVHN